MQSASAPKRCHFSTLPPRQSFHWPLIPPLPSSKVLCSKNPVTIDAPLVSFPKNCLTQNLVIPLLIGSCYDSCVHSTFLSVLRRSSILALDGPQTSCHLTVVISHPLFRCNSSDIWLSFPNSMCRCCICLA